MRARAGRVCLTLLFVLTAASALAQSYPTRLVTMLVPFPAGSGPDVYARIVAAKLAPRLGQSVVVENRAGRKLPKQSRFFRDIVPKQAPR